MIPILYAGPLGVRKVVAFVLVTEDSGPAELCTPDPVTLEPKVPPTL